MFDNYAGYFLLLFAMVMIYGIIKGSRKDPMLLRKEDDMESICRRLK